MRIGQLAKCTGASVQTLRYYEREGVLRKPIRTASGYRAYAAADVEHVLFVKRCQKVGFSLQDIKQLSAMHGMIASPPTTAARKREQFLSLARQRAADLDMRIAALQQLRSQIGSLVGFAETQPEGCPAAFRDRLEAPRAERAPAADHQCPPRPGSPSRAAARGGASDQRERPNKEWRATAKKS